MPRQSESTLAAVKQAVDIVALIGDYLPLHRNGSKFKAICPFHDDHHPSMEVNPERQSFKCWACGAGGDIFDFVESYERVDFTEALRMLAERAGVSLGTTARDSELSKPEGPGRAELLRVSTWARQKFAESLSNSLEACEYVRSRGLKPESIGRFHLGHAPDRRDWLQTAARREGISHAALEAAGLVTRNEETGLTHDRFRGRLIFPIHDMLGRVLGFGGRILPEAERGWIEQGRRAAKYLNSPETAIFQKRKQLYAADLARAAARQEGWVVVVEGYTDVIAAHQAGLENVVGTLGTALGDDHVLQLRRLADRVVLVFDGDEAGQKAADRALELFLSHALDMRVLTLPGGVDPCDFLVSEGVEAFLALVETAIDPLDFAIQRATDRYDLESPEGTRLAAEWVLSVLARVPSTQRAGMELKVAKALDTLSRRLRLPVSELHGVMKQQRRTQQRVLARATESQTTNTGLERLTGSTRTGSISNVAKSDEQRSVKVSELDRLDRELVQLVLNEPELVPSLRARIPAEALQDSVLRSILQACYELDAEGESPSFERVSLRLDDPALRSLAAGLLLPLDPAPLRAGTQPAPVEARLHGILQGLAERDWRQRLRDLEAAKAEVDPSQHPDDFRALQREYLRVLNQRPGLAKKSSAS